MNILCSTNLINKALQAIQKPLSSKVTNSLLNGVYIETLENRIEIKASDLEFSAIISIPAQINVQGKILVAGKQFIDILKRIPSEEVVIYTTSEDNLIHIETNSSEYNLLSMPINEYPSIEKINNNKPVLTINAEILKNLTNKTSFACSKNPTNNVFKGVYLDIKNGEITCVATDTHRLAIKKHQLENKNTNVQVLLPNDFLTEISKNLTDEQDQDTVELYIHNNKIAIQINNLYMQSSSLEGKYPDYEKVIPKDFNTRTTFDVNEMVGAVERASIFSKDGKYINCKITKQEFIVTVNNPDLGKAREVIGCKTQGNDIDITFNSEYIIQILKKFDEQEASIYINSASSPCSVRQGKDESYNYIISPMRVNSN